MNRNFEIEFSENAFKELEDIKQDKSKKGIAKAVVKAISFMSVDLRHPSLNTHEYDDIAGPKGEKVFESYAQNRTPGAYRIFWYYGPGKSKITILAICPHP